MKAFKVFWSSLGSFYYDMGTLALGNLIYLVLTASVVAAGPALAGLYDLTAQVNAGEYPSFRTFLASTRRYFWQGWLVAGAAFVLSLLLLSNIFFYLNLTYPWQLLAIVWFYVFLFWLGMLNYLLPLLIQQQDKRLRNLLRIAAILVLAQPVYTLIMLLLQALILVLSLILVLPLFLFTFSFLALYQNKALEALLEQYRSKSD